MRSFEDKYTETVFEPCEEGSGVRLDDFRAYMPSHSYLFMPCREMWPAASVDARVPPQEMLDEHGKPMMDKKGNIKTMPASQWLDEHKPVEQVTWCPGLPMLIANRLVVDGGWIERRGVTCFNLYREPRIIPGDASLAGRWVDHVRRVFEAPGDADHIIKWLAHRVQRPGEKINHGLILGGAQGIGKDTILEPVKLAVGPWNFHEISPSDLLERFNPYVKSVILRVNEARDLGDAERVNRFSFYDRTKVYTASPPDVLRVNEKHLREYYAFNTLGFLLTTNYKTDGIYLPSDDRRHYVAWSGRTKDEFTKQYWDDLWGWYIKGGFAHVTAYLNELDLSDFHPKSPPPKTAAFWDAVNVNTAPEDAELADVLDALGNPDALAVSQLAAAAIGGAADWLSDRKYRRVIPHRLERCGYVSVRNPDAADGVWKKQGVRQSVYAKATLSVRERLGAASKLDP